MQTSRIMMCVTRYSKFAAAGALALALAACSSSNSRIDPKYGVAASPRVSKAAYIPSGGGRYQVGKPYKIAGKWYKPKEVKRYERTGVASWYGDAFHGRKTANGEIYNMNAYSAAHPTLPLPSYVRVTNLANRNSVVVRVNDRGPFARNRLIDLSKRAAGALDFRRQGVAKVHVSYLGRAPVDGGDAKFLEASVHIKGRGRPGIQRIAGDLPADTTPLAYGAAAQIYSGPFNDLKNPTASGE
ncbi:septal ring lytic transglycosylase RlpA family protein [Pararhizobium sp. IMCC21322]|uniref:septal ring lytic transglycosylase RlpA family protein n=1 Tax=Pararhizobium sp. IMCC21322 TaxID=3067903 RepID=UPI00353187BB